MCKQKDLYALFVQVCYVCKYCINSFPTQNNLRCGNLLFVNNTNRNNSLYNEMQKNICQCSHIPLTPYERLLR